MRLSTILLLPALLACASSLVAQQNPFAPIGREAPLLTLTKGQYPEVFTNDTLRIVCGMVYNRVTKQVVGFVETDTVFSESGMKPELVSRWLSMDPLAGKYPYASPYNFGLNTPIQSYDPDGRVVIFINGQHGGTGGTAKYWGGYDKKAMGALGDRSARYVDGAMGGWKNTALWAGGVGPVGTLLYSNVNRDARIKAGHVQGMTDAADIIRNLKEGETIKIVTHSMGTAFADGYTSGIYDYASINGLQVSIEYELDVNAFQGADLGDPWVKGIRRQNKTGGLDGGGHNLFKTRPGNSVPTVAPIPGSENISDPSDANKGHAIEEMSTSGIPHLGNGGNSQVIEQGRNNEKNR